MAKKRRADMTPEELERERAYHRAKYQEHKEKRKAASRARYHRTPEKFRAYAKNYAKEHPEEVRAYQANYRRTHRVKGPASTSPKGTRPPRSGGNPAEAAARAILRDAQEVYREMKRNYEHLAAQPGVMPARLRSAQDGLRAAYRGVLEAQAELLRVQGKSDH